MLSCIGFNSCRFYSHIYSCRNLAYTTTNAFCLFSIVVDCCIFITFVICAFAYSIPKRKFFIGLQDFAIDIARCDVNVNISVSISPSFSCRSTQEIPFSILFCFKDIFFGNISFKFSNSYFNPGAILILVFYLASNNKINFRSLRKTCNFCSFSGRTFSKNNIICINNTYTNDFLCIFTSRTSYFCFRRRTFCNYTKAKHAQYNCNHENAHKPFNHIYKPPYGFMPLIISLNFSYINIFM